MNLLEKCIVTEDFCNRNDTYNIMEGGSGGWSYVNSNLTHEFHVNIGKIGSKNLHKKYKEAYGSYRKYQLNKWTDE
jgi:hypothetical protein